jgi:hypothetical protein
MMHTPEERFLLEKLAKGLLDGTVGDEREYRVYRSIYCGKQIRNGVPVSYRQDKPSGTTADGEPVEREEEIFDTEERKLEFLQRYGWLMKDKDVRAYSEKYKPGKKK